MSALTRPAIAEVWRWLAEIPDPEVPAISIVDLGIVREVREEFAAGEAVTIVTITPTYSGCPAMDMIAQQIDEKLRERGVDNLRLETRLSPPWTTGWMSARGREQLREYGIAPPSGQAGVVTFHRKAQPDPVVQCPRCASANTECISEFGSTACKAQYRCRDCLEPFDYFKSI